MNDFVYWPVAVHPNPRNALLICYGVGSTAKALTDTKRLRSIDVVDISSDILANSTIIFPHKKDNPLYRSACHRTCGGWPFLFTNDPASVRHYHC